MTNPVDETPLAGGSSEDSSAAENQDRPNYNTAAESGQPAEETLGESVSEPIEQGPAEPAAEANLQEPADDDGLPEVIPLTPELVEDEAIRGDFMLRAFVVLLAVLLGCAEIAETRTLVHVKTGQYLGSHGWLPPRTDVFSYTAQERPWVNLSWLFDLLLSLTFDLGGVVAMTIFKIFLVTLTILIVVFSVRSNASTWWGSVCAALALLACYPQLTILPELVTLLGLALTLWIMQRWQMGTSAATLWWLVPTFVLWSNLDNRMFLGLVLLLLYAAGELVGSWFGRNGLSDAARRRQLWSVIAVCLLAACLNPFGWNSLTAPFTLYGIEYPALRHHYFINPGPSELQYYPILSKIFWGKLGLLPATGLLLLAATAVVLVMNRKKVEWGHVSVFVGFVVLAMVASHELAAAAVVACVLCTLNAQDWYRENYPQTYSIELSERIFSSGGRAVTVLTFFVVAFLASSGRLKDPNDRRIGFGLQPELQTTIEGLRTDLEEENSFNRRPFNFIFRQGDLLIWLDRKVFVDSRVSVYSGTGRDDLLTIHDQTRRSLRVRQQRSAFSGRDEIWKATFDRFDVTHVLPRLSGPNSDYPTFFALLSSPDWQLANLGSMTSVFYRTSFRKQYPKLAEYLDAHQFDMPDKAFRQQSQEPTPRGDWPRPRSAYQNFLTRPKPNRLVSVQAAGHYNQYLKRYLQNQPGSALLQSPELGFAAAHLAIRYANQGLADDPQSAEAFRALVSAYLFLQAGESIICQRSGLNYDAALRTRQAIHALGQLRTLQPSNPDVHEMLFRIYAQKGQVELALQSLDEYERLEIHRPGPSDQQATIQQQQQQQQQQRAREALPQAVNDRLMQINEIASSGADLVLVARFAYQNGCALRALELLEDDPELSRRNMIATPLMRAELFMEAGRLEEAEQELLNVQGMAEQIGLPGWRTPLAMVKLANGDYQQAIQLWTDQRSNTNDRRMNSLFSSFPLVCATQPLPIWPLVHLQQSASALLSLPNENAQLLLNVALSHLETGRNKAATEIFQKILEIAPDSSVRPLVAFYLLQLTGEEIEPLPPSDWISLDVLPRDEMDEAKLD